jgi:hypothetical protein
MQIASNPMIRTHLEKLPSTWTVVHEIAKLDPPAFEALVDDGTINPDTTSTDLKKATGEHSKRTRHPSKLSTRRLSRNRRQRTWISNHAAHQKARRSL